MTIKVSSNSSLLPYADAGEQEQDEICGERGETGGLEVQELDLHREDHLLLLLLFLLLLLLLLFRVCRAVAEEDVGQPQVAVAYDCEAVAGTNLLHLQHGIFLYLFRITSPIPYIAHLYPVEVPGEVHEPLVVPLVSPARPEELGQAGHDGSDGALGEALSAGAVQGVLAQVRVPLKDGFNWERKCCGNVSLSAGCSVYPYLRSNPASCSRTLRGTWPIP